METKDITKTTTDHGVFTDVPCMVGFLPFDIVETYKVWAENNLLMIGYSNLIVSPVKETKVVENSITYSLYIMLDNDTNVVITLFKENEICLINVFE